MSDEQNQDPNPNPPAEGTAAPAEPTFTAADIERIIAADREQRASSPSEPDDPIAKFRATTHGTKLYAAKKAAEKPAAPQQQGSRLESLVESMLALQIANMKPPAPPAPPKPMSAVEKLASADPAIWLKRGSANEWSGADRDQLVQQHAAELRKQGYRFDIDQEANARASRDVVAAGRKALSNIKIGPGGSGFVSFDLSTIMGRK